MPKVGLLGVAVMKKICIGIASLLALFATQASAADMAVKAPLKAPAPTWSWTGFYLGLEGGGGWARTRQADTVGVTSGNYNQSGGLIGGTIGYNWQLNNIVFGLEADMSWAGIDGSVTIPAVCTAGSGSV